MKIAFISDTHLGYAWNSEIAEDSIRQAREAFLKAMDLGVDLIVHPGDIFDERMPKPEVWVEALRIFSLTFLVPDTGLKPILPGNSSGNLTGNPTGNSTGNQGNQSPLPFKGVPVVAIHGNHERRGGDFKNPVQALEAAGHLVYLDKSNIVLEKDGEKVNIFGMSYVPESYSLETLKGCNTNRLEDAFNIFVMHQNIKEYLPEDVCFIGFDDLPKFDLIVNGHIHWNDYREMGDWAYMMPGSTVVTQFKKQEAERRKGFYVFDTDKRRAEFITLDDVRPFVFRELSFKDSEASLVHSEVREVIEDELSKHYTMKPVIKVKLSGSLKAGRNIDPTMITRGLDDDAIILIDNRLEAVEFKKRIEELRQIQTSKLGAENLGLAILRKKLGEAGYDGVDPEDVFEPLVAGDIEGAMGMFIQHYRRILNKNTSSE